MESPLVGDLLSGIAMPPRVIDKALPAQREAGLVGIPQLDMPALNSLAVQSLVSLFDEEAMLFARRITVTEQGLRRQGASRRGTMIALLGLQRLAESGVTE